MGHIGLCMRSNSTSSSDNSNSSSSADNMEMHEVTAGRPTASSVVTVRLYSRSPGSTERLRVAYREGLTAEHLCHRAARECGISRLGANLFAVFDDGAKAWLSPAALVRPSEAHLAFRLRFHMPKAAANITSLEQSIVTYMFAQYRHDFLQDKIEGISLEETLGLMVLDMVRYSCEKRVSIRRCLHRSLFKKFLPRSLYRDLNVLDKWKLKRKIRSSLVQFEQCDQDVNSCRMMYLISLMEEHPSWGVEKFETVKGQTYAASIAAKGVKQIAPADQVNQFKLLFADVISIGMMASRADETSNWIVLVNQREDAPKEFIMEDKKAAESLVSLIDGYHRLQVDYYNFLCYECAPASLLQLVKSRCHGPIPLSCAKRKIEEAGTENGIYLIRQNPEDFLSYCMTVRLDNRIKNYKINIHEDDSVSLPGQRTFPNVKVLAEHYKNPINCSCLDGCLTKSLPYLSGEESLHLHDLSTLPEPPKQPPPDPPIEWINQNNMSNRKRWKKLGGGDFTTVYRGEIQKRDKPSVSVAIKCPNHNAGQQVQQKFSNSVDIMSSWINQSIIKFIGIGAGFSLIMEYAPYGSMDTFLQTHKSKIRESHQVAMAVQLIDALEYLESRKVVHGNITAHNVLVVRCSPALRVKLGDPMLSKYYHSFQMAKKMKRVRWTAPELLHPNTEPTLESDRWSFGMALWQIMSLGQIPYANKSDEEVFSLYALGRFPPFPAKSSNNMNNLIANCLTSVPSDRFPCKHLLQELNRMYMTCQEEEDGRDIVWDIPADDYDPEPIMEDLSEEEEEDEDHRASDEEAGQATPSQAPFLLSNGPISPAFAVEMMRRGSIEVKERGAPVPNPVHVMKFCGIEKVAEGTLQIGDVIGKGNFGRVCKGLWHRSPGNKQEVAVKEVRDCSNKAEMEQFEEEIRRLSLLDHKNIVKVLGVMEGGPLRPLQMVMEYVQLGALNTYLQKRKRENIVVKLSTMLTFAQQVAQGMAYLGDRKVVHRDLFARNVLVASDATESSTELEVKISDFGLARNYTSEGYYEASGKNRMLPVKLYAIECIKTNPSECKFSSKSDVWTFAVLLWEIFSYCDKPAYMTNTGRELDLVEIPIFLREGKRLHQPKDCPPGVYYMMLECWNLDRHTRPTFRELVDRIGHMLENEGGLYGF